MPKLIVLMLLLLPAALTVRGQSIAALNYRYQYDPQNEADLSLKLVNEKTRLSVYYRLQPTGTTGDGFTITWQRLESFTEKEGTALSSPDSAGLSGRLSFPVPEKPWLLVAKVRSKSSARSWTYFQLMDPKYPVNGFLESSEGILFKSYAVLGKEYAVQGPPGTQTLHVYFYRTDFPVASPPFAEKGAHVDRFVFADSTFRVSPGQKITLKSKGLYLVQQDTTAAEGFSFIAVNASYPRLTRLEDIPDPLIFVSAKEEHDELLAAGNDKTRIDKVILDITGDKDRAKNFMKSYFRRVELCNTFFTSYKEGWKTDRGMIYLIFGIPDEVGRNNGNEVWYYKNYKERFTFVKIGSVYDPNNYILQRSSRFGELWFNTVDQWRKNRL